MRDAAGPLIRGQRLRIQKSAVYQPLFFFEF